MRIDKPIGLYVHIPFCVRKCNYCDFASFSPSDEFRESYIDALTREITAYRGREITLDTVFFGGGTPSLLSPSELRKIMNSVREGFTITSEAEISAEVNPATLTEEKLDAFLSEGFNRFSIGVQSIHENELKILGRIHSFDDFIYTYNMMRERGVSNIGVDLMFGIPEQTKESFTETLSEIIKLSPEHISAYGLILEENTPFWDMKNELHLPTEESERDMYFTAVKILGNAGYTHYEISNFAKDGKASQHNLKYWRFDEYIGVGLSAHSFFDGERFSNSPLAKEYLSGIRDYEDKLSQKDAMFEYAMLALRTSRGLSLREYQERFGVDFLSGREAKISLYKDCGLLCFDKNRIYLTAEGFYLSNTVISDLL